MASGVRKLPVRTGKRLRLPFAVLDKLRSMETGQNVSLHCDNTADPESTFEATVTPDFLEIEISKGGEQTTLPSSTIEDSGDVRRSSRRKNTKSALELLGITPRKVQAESPGRKPVKGKVTEGFERKSSVSEKSCGNNEEIEAEKDATDNTQPNTQADKEKELASKEQIEEGQTEQAMVLQRRIRATATQLGMEVIETKEPERKNIHPATIVSPQASRQQEAAISSPMSSEQMEAKALVKRNQENTSTPPETVFDISNRKLIKSESQKTQADRPSTRALSAAKKQMVTRSSPRTSAEICLQALPLSARKRRSSPARQDPAPKHKKQQLTEATKVRAEEKPEEAAEPSLIMNVEEHPNEGNLPDPPRPVTSEDCEPSDSDENVSNVPYDPDQMKNVEEGVEQNANIEQAPSTEPGDITLVSEQEKLVQKDPIPTSTTGPDIMLDPHHDQKSDLPSHGQVYLNQPKLKKLKPGRKRVTKKIVKAVVISSSGETKEVIVGEEVSTVKALEQIIAGAKACNTADIPQLAQDVHRELEKTMSQSTGSDAESEEDRESVRKLPEGRTVKQVMLHTIQSDEPLGEPEKSILPVEGGEAASVVEAVSKMALKALNEVPPDQQVTIEVSGDDAVNMDWLKRLGDQGVQVILLNDTENHGTAGKGQSTGRRLVEGLDNEGLAANMLAEEKIRAKPSKHIISSDRLAKMIDELKPDDQMTNHIKIVSRNTDRVRHMMCNYCGVFVRDKHDFRRHMAKHKDVEYKPWKCPVCDYRAAVRAQIARHVNIHGEMKPFVCKECGKGFNFKQKLQLHLKYHLDIRDKKCPHCELAFHEYKTLKNHLLKIHNVTKVPKMQTKSPVELSEGDESDAEGGSQGELTKVKDGDVTAEGTGGKIKDEGVQDGKNPNPQIEDGSGDSNTEAGCAATILPVTEAGDNLEVPKGKISKRHRSSLLYGTRKTFLYTQQYKMGLLPAADRNDVQVKLKMDFTKSAAAGEALKKDKNCQRQRLSRVTSTEQLEPEMRQYCKVEKSEDGSQVTFQCQVCEVGPFSSKTKFLQHLEQVHDKIRAWKCHSCDYTCRMRSSLIVHMKLHTGIKEFPCTRCGKLFMYKQKLKNHMKHHLNLREYKCGLCEKAFNEKNDLTKHVSRVHVADRPWVCTECNKSYKEQVQLKRHMESHTALKTHLCEVCNKYYRSKMSLAQHMKSHTCMFHCEICDKNFGSYSGFMAHKVMHDESYEGYECEICRKVLHTKGSLTRHRSVAHSNARPFGCTDCGKQFKTKKDLKNHMVVHSTERNFICNICQFSCKRMESLRVHMRRHAEVKPFQCGVCGKEYTQKHALEIHLRHHSGSVEAQCGICGREFFTKYQLDMHMRRKHQLSSADKTGLESLPDSIEGTTVALSGGELALDSDKPVTVFMCEECNSVFLSQDSLAVHILAEHMKQGWTSTAPSTDNTVTTSTATSLLQPPLGGDLAEDLAEASIVENTVEVTTEREPGEVFQGQQTIETLVSISDPSSARQKIVSLIHPIRVSQDSFEDTESEPKAETAEERFSLLGGATSSQEAVVTIADPSTNQEMLVTLPHSNFESLLAATEAEVQADGSYVADAAGETYITVSTDQPQPESDPGIHYVTVSDTAIEVGPTLVAMAAGGVMETEADVCVSVAETIEIPVETEGPGE